MVQSICYLRLTIYYTGNGMLLYLQICNSFFFLFVVSECDACGMYALWLDEIRYSACKIESGSVFFVC